MPDAFYDSDDPTLPLAPKSNQNQPARQGANNFADSPQGPERRPYQYPPQPPQGPPQRPLQGPASPFPGPHQQMPPARPAPNGNPDIARYPYQQPGQRAGNFGAPPLPQPQKRPRRRTGCLVSSLIALLLVCLLGGFAITTTQRVLAFGSAISPQAPLSTQTGYMSTSDRVSLLVMGYGGGSHDGSYLTDSMLVVSVLPQSHHTSLVSVPRDLWVQYPPNSGNYTKINSIYELASKNNKDPQASGEAAYQKVSLVTGLRVSYWLTIDFTGFKQVIDAIGGIDVYVPDSFNACYPKNDDAAIDPSWIKVQFNKGMQHMNGNTAITYARAREPLEVCGKGKSENLAELTDFGRSARQQIIVKAVLAKVKQLSTWPHLYAAMDALQHAIHTNMSLADLSAFALKMDLTDPKAAHIGLSNQNVLVDATSNDGQYILLPQNDNWGAIQDYVKRNLYN
jgi:polyisoprenyl-teichoic acid--peptidoglycan teichoic acid transferase